MRAAGKLAYEFFWVIPIPMFAYFVFLSKKVNPYIFPEGVFLFTVSILLFLFIKYRFEIIALSLKDAGNFLVNILNKAGNLLVGHSPSTYVFMTLILVFPPSFFLWLTWSTLVDMWDSIRGRRYRDDHNPHIEKFKQQIAV